MSNSINDDDNDAPFDDIEHRHDNVEPNSSDTVATTTLIDDKWSCPVCTYLNFAVAQKCTMCRQPKIITMDAASSDIYQLNLPLETNAQVEQAQQQIPATYIDSVEKWPCEQCTFLNYPRAIRCTQCGSYRLIGAARVSPVQPPIDTNTNERISPPPSIGDSRVVAHRLRKWTCNKCTTDSKWKRASILTRILFPLKSNQENASGQPNSSRFLENNTALNFERSRSRKQIHSNSSRSSRLVLSPIFHFFSPDFPATKKCISCGLPRHQNSTNSTVTNTSTPTCPHSSSTCASILIGNDEEQRMNAINKSMENINVERLSNKESRHQRIGADKRLMTNKRACSSAASDRLWLKACQTLLDRGSSTIVFEYFICGGDPFRQITIEDTQILNCSYLSSIDLVGRTLKSLANVTGQIEQFCKIETAFQQLIRQQKKIPHQRRVPANICTRLNGMIQHFFQSFLKLKKITDFHSYFLTEWFTAVLPAGRKRFTGLDRSLLVVPFLYQRFVTFLIGRNNRSSMISWINKFNKVNWPSDWWSLLSSTFQLLKMPCASFQNSKWTIESSTGIVKWPIDSILVYTHCGIGRMAIVC